MIAESAHTVAIACAVGLHGFGDSAQVQCSTMLGSFEMAMDIETAEAVETLRSDIHQVDRSLTAEIYRVETSLTAEIGRVETSLTAEIGRVESSLTARIDGVESSLTAQITTLTTEIGRVEASLSTQVGDTRRHMDVVAESLRDDIRMIAEGVVALTAKVDSLPR